MKHNGKYKKITKTVAKNKTYVGYCYSPQHKGYLTADVLKYHQCVHKAIKDENGNVTMRECPALQKLEHPYWKEKEHARLLRRLKKLIKGTSLTDRSLKKMCEDEDWNEEQVTAKLTTLLRKDDT